MKIKDLNILNISLGGKILAGYLLGIIIMVFFYSFSLMHLGTITREYEASMGKGWKAALTLREIRILQKELVHERLMPVRRPSFEESQKRLVFLMEHNLQEFIRDERALGGRYSLELMQSFNAFKNNPENYALFDSILYVLSEKTKNDLVMIESGFIRRVNELLLINALLSPLFFVFLWGYGFFLSNNVEKRMRKITEGFDSLFKGTYKMIDDRSEDDIGKISRYLNELSKRAVRKY